jgi:hypothetical protein
VLEEQLLELLELGHGHATQEEDGNEPLDDAAALDEEELLNDIDALVPGDQRVELGLEVGLLQIDVEAADIGHRHGEAHKVDASHDATLVQMKGLDVLHAVHGKQGNRGQLRALVQLEGHKRRPMLFGDELDVFARELMMLNLQEAQTFGHRYHLTQSGDGHGTGRQVLEAELGGTQLRDEGRESGKVAGNGELFHLAFRDPVPDGGNDSLCCQDERGREQGVAGRRRKTNKNVQGRASRKNVLMPKTNDLSENILTILLMTLVSVLTLEKQMACSEENSVCRDNNEGMDEEQWMRSNVQEKKEKKARASTSSERIPFGQHREHIQS